MSTIFQALRKFKFPINWDQVEIVYTDHSLRVSELYEWYVRGWLYVDPEIQREYVWTPEQASFFIESLMLGMATQPIHVAEVAEFKLFIIDGLQRIESIKRFLEDKIVFQPAYLTKLRGKKFSEFPPEYRDRLLNSYLTLYIYRIRARTETEKWFVICEMFRRLNAGVTPLPALLIIVHTVKTPFTLAVKKIARSELLNDILAFTNEERRRAENYVVALTLVYLADKILSREVVPTVISYTDALRRMLRTDIPESYSEKICDLVFTVLNIMKRGGLTRLDFRRGTGKYSKYLFAGVFAVLAEAIAAGKSLSPEDVGRVVKKFIDELRRDYFRWREVTENKSIGVVIENLRPRILQS